MRLSFVTVLSGVLTFVMIQTAYSQTVLYNAERLANWDPNKLNIYLEIVGATTSYLKGTIARLGFDTTHVEDAQNLQKFYKDPMSFVLNHPNLDLRYLFARIDSLSSIGTVGLSDTVKFNELVRTVHNLGVNNARRADSTDSLVHVAGQAIDSIKAWQAELANETSLLVLLERIDTAKIPDLQSLSLEMINDFWNELLSGIGSLQSSRFIVDSSSVEDLVTVCRDTAEFNKLVDSLGSTNYGINLLLAVSDSSGKSLFNNLLSEQIAQTPAEAVRAGPVTGLKDLIASEQSKGQLDPIQFRNRIGALRLDTSAVVLDMFSKALVDELRSLSDSLYFHERLERLSDCMKGKQMQSLRDPQLALYCKRILADSGFQHIRNQISTKFLETTTILLDSTSSYQDFASKHLGYANHDIALVNLLNSAKKEGRNSVTLKSMLEALNVSTEIVPVSQGQDLSTVTTSPKVTSSSGSLSESQAIDAIGSFISEQFEEDLVQSLLQGIESTIGGKRVDYLFPRTFTLLHSADTAGLSLNDITLAIRRSMYDDMHTVIDSLANHECDTNCAIYIDDTLRTLLKVAVDFANKINEGYTPTALFQYMYMRYSKYDFVSLAGISSQHTIRVLSRFISFFYTFESSFQDTCGNRGGPYWIPLSRFAPLANNLQVRKLFAALLYQQILKDGKPLDTLSNAWTHPQFVDTLVARCYNVLTGLEDLQIAAQRFSADNKSSTVSVLDKYFTSYLNVLGRITGVYTWLTGETLDTSFISLSRCVFYGYKSVISGDYSTLLSSTVDIAGECVRYYSQIQYSKRTKNDSARAIAALSNYRNTVAYLDKYLGLFVDLVNAKNQDDLKNAISRASNESGGFMSKKRAGFKISLDAYAGLFSGTEYANSQKALGNVGFSSPIGLDLTFDRHNEGVLLSVFDFGPVVSYRLGNGMSAGFPSNVTFAQLISPGLYFKFSPWQYNALTILLGIEVTPELRSISDTVAVLRKGTYYRAGLSLTYDIPFFYFTQSQGVTSDDGFMMAKTGEFSLSVDSYPGLFGGWSTQNTSHAAPAVPVGLDVRLGLCNLGMFVPVIDFGSMIVSNSYGIIGSLGGFVYLTFSNKCPITLLAGFERNVSPSPAGTYNRYGAILAYDIPFFYLSR